MTAAAAAIAVLRWHGNALSGAGSWLPSVLLDGTGGLAGRITEKFFSVVDSRMASAIESKNLEGNSSAQPLSPREISRWLGAAEKMIEFGKGILSQIVGKVAVVVAFPFLAVFTVVLVVSAAILYGGYALMG